MDLNTQNLKRLLSRWSLTPLSYRIAEGGIVNNNTIVDTPSGRYVLREVNQFKNLKGLKLEFDYLDYLKNSGFKYEIPEPMKCVNGKKFTRYRGRYFWLYKYIEGTIKDRLTAEEIRKVADMMVKYHKIVIGSRFAVQGKMRDPLFRNAIMDQSKKLKKRAIRARVNDKVDRAFLQNVDKLMAMLSSFNLTDYSKLKVYHLHKDFRQSNIIWNGDKILGLLDFDWVGWSPETIAKDISVVIEYCCASNNNKDRPNLKLAKAFIKEYGRYLNISKTEVVAIPLLIASHYVDLFNYTYSLLKENDKKAANLDIARMAEAALWYSKNAKSISIGLLSG